MKSVIDTFGVYAIEASLLAKLKAEFPGLHRAPHLTPGIFPCPQADFIPQQAPTSHAYEGEEYEYD